MTIPFHNCVYCEEKDFTIVGLINHEFYKHNHKMEIFNEPQGRCSTCIALLGYLNDNCPPKCSVAKAIGQPMPPDEKLKEYADVGKEWLAHIHQIHMGIKPTKEDAMKLIHDQLNRD
jgi:hypothetical protein